MTPIDAIIEIAGGDAFAAAVAYAEERRPGRILPTYVHTGTEFGDFAVIERHVEILRDDLMARFGTVVAPLEVSGDPELWRALNGRFITEIRERFGFFSPCIGCHLYLHLMRLPAAARAGSVVIVSGEREIHSCGAKINQTPDVLDAYSTVLRSAGFELAMPVRQVRTRAELTAIAPWLWEEGGEQMKCVLSGNYRALDGVPIMPDANMLKRYIDSFLVPAGKALARTILDGDADYQAVVASVLEMT